ncbi:hypothetical protein Prudu_012861 [Prunus dulcis]|uniref:Secreted protein n=1 Tax=Prunus dulcis TaxID=3755 RepID=A0A4Y1REK5_PRUDU|nr:hypothetical protein Prudu_012861 [Prunus dulcis]
MISIVTMYSCLQWTTLILSSSYSTDDCPPVAAAVHTLKEPCVSDSEDSDATDSEMLPGASEGSLVF